jgi:hypothetical protein
MRNNQKGVTFLSGTLGMAGAGLVLAGGLVYNAGSVRVSVLEKHPGGDSIRVIVPAATVPLAMAFVPDRAFRHVPPEAKQLLPALQAAAKELRSLPDCVLVKVHDARDDVSVAVRDGVLVIDVDSDDEEVHVQVPLGAVESVMSRLASANET